MSSSPAPAFNPSTANTRLNSLTHGATSKQLFIPGEDPAEFIARLEDNFRYYKPVTQEQAALVEDATIAHWHHARVQRVHGENEFDHYTAKPDVIDWNNADMDRLNKFDRYKTQAERSLQRALANVRAFHKENIRTRQWQQLHELRQQKFEIQRDRFELAKARESRLAAKSQNSETNAANKADSEIRSAKNAVPSPPKTAPQGPQSTPKPAPQPQTAPAPQTPEEFTR
jgi:hypothetical protein